MKIWHNYLARYHNLKLILVALQKIPYHDIEVCKKRKTY